MKTKSTFIALLLACGGLGAQAQAIYRCGNTYSQQPCADGTLVKVDDARSPGAAAAAGAETRRQAKAADAMEKARLHEEAKAAPASVMQTTKAEPAPEPREKETAEAKKHAKKKTAKKPEYFTAVAPKKPGEKAAKKTAKKKSAKEKSAKASA